MKSRQLITLLMLLVVVLSACQMGQPAATEAPGYPGPAQGAPPVQAPASEGAYPYPGQEIIAGATPMYPAILYPDAKDGDEIYWGMVMAMIQNGEVATVTQTHERQLFITLKDGRSFISWEPNVDDVLKVIQECGVPCKDIAVSTE
jgi:hypothetical protein